MKKNTMMNTNRRTETFDQKLVVIPDEVKKNQTMMNNWNIQRIKIRVTLKRRAKQKGIIYIRSHNMNNNMTKSFLLMKKIEEKKFQL
jgi:hypothetical protein